VAGDTAADVVIAGSGIAGALLAARKGDDPKSSVVDGALRCHDHPNLFILGSAAFPTSATANPTLTIAALSLRAAASVKQSLGG